MLLPTIIWEEVVMPTGIINVNRVIFLNMYCAVSTPAVM
jgi:hypothetical protein